MEYLARLRQFRQKMTLKTWNPHFKKFLKKNYLTYGIVLYRDERPANSTHFDVSFIFLLQLGAEPEAAKVEFKRSLVAAKRLVRLTWNLHGTISRSYAITHKNFSSLRLFLLFYFQFLSHPPPFVCLTLESPGLRSKYQTSSRDLYKMPLLHNTLSNVLF